jgi:hypothetical protein
MSHHNVSSTILSGTLSNLDVPTCTFDSAKTVLICYSKNNEVNSVE